LRKKERVKKEAGWDVLKNSENEKKGRHGVMKKKEKKLIFKNDA
jgi:hypothetical protein